MIAAASTAGGFPSFAAAEPAPDAKPPVFDRKIKVGLVGCGSRGAWIAGLFQKHGGYEFQAVADYFQPVADKCGDALGVDKSRRFSTLSGYKKVLESGIDAVILEVPPFFFPEHARAAVEAGLHVYMAKPVAVDVPGCLQIEAAARQATEKKRCFLIDYQMPTDPANQEVVKRIHTEGFGKISQIATVGRGAGSPDPPKTDTIEDRLQRLIWIHDIALSGDLIGNFDIHAIDAALWAVGKRPVAAMGASRICRADANGDSHDVCSVVFEYDDGLVHNHFGQALKNQMNVELSCRVFGQKANALINYWGKATFKSFDDNYSADVEDLYANGAPRNIAAFYRNVTEGHFENETVRRSVDGALTTILGREAAERRTRLTMDALIKENRRLEVDLRGLKT